MTASRSAELILPYGILILAACGEDGTVLDPSSTVNALANATNNRSSFAAFEDEDRNGIEDHRR